MKAPALVHEVQTMVPNLDMVADRLRDDPERALAHVLARPDRRLATALVGAPLDEIPPELLQPARPALERTLAGARRAIEKIRRDGIDADLAPDERNGSEAIIIVFGRPAILVQEGRFSPPPDDWKKLEERRAAIEATLGSVGRIEITGHPRYRWVGTGFVVGDDVVITNRHVVKEFARPAGSGWEFERGMTARIDFAEELGSVVPKEFPVVGVVGVHEEVDLALLRVARASGPRRLPRPLPVDRDVRLAGAGREVYVVGYPAADPDRNDPEVMAQIFANIYGVKRLQPGKIRRSQGVVFHHDCSTLGGNSGSCVIDLETGHVVGLHYEGFYLEANWAVTLAKLADDPLVRANVAFGSSTLGPALLGPLAPRNRPVPVTHFDQPRRKRANGTATGLDGPLMADVEHLHPVFRERVLATGRRLRSGARTRARQLELYECRRRFLATGHCNCADGCNPANVPGTSWHEFGPDLRGGEWAMAVDFEPPYPHGAPGLCWPIRGEPWHAQPSEIPEAERVAGADRRLPAPGSLVPRPPPPDPWDDLFVPILT